jgi:hypothetical protein
MYKCDTCDAPMDDDLGICYKCFYILLDDLENSHENHESHQEEFHKLTGRRWMPGGGYRLRGGE